MNTSTSPTGTALPIRSVPGSAPRGRRARSIAGIMAGVAAALAATAGATAAVALADADPAVLMVETWRAVGFFTFAALFVLLAARPLASPALWLIVIGNKLALAIAGLSFGPGIAGAPEAAAWDGAITLLLTAGFAAAMIARRAPQAT